MMSSEGHIVAKKEVDEFIKNCCEAIGIQAEHSSVLADVLVSADYRGHYSHGIKNIDVYLNDVRNKVTAVAGIPEIVKQSASTALVDGNNLLGPVVGRFCMDLAIEEAKSTGIGWVSARESNHFGMAAWYGLRAVNHGLVGMAFTNTGSSMAPSRARQNALGTNPICVAAPGNDGDCFVLDMATTTVAFGKIALAQMKGKPIPEGWAVDKDGKDTVDPAEMYGILPLGGRENTSGYKGYGLAVMVEMFCSMLSDSVCGYKMAQGIHESCSMSHCFVALNPEMFEDGFQDRLSDLMNFCRNLDPADGESEVLAPGDPERKHMEICDKQGGILYHPSQIKAANETAARLGVKPLTTV
ncbi:uncharacterized oxidoreductase YjmC-like [Mercenaria mercenaria]|uniref:uncharacterized oxidoreductase YjmC-like n=1 Tax=Mercenaria mercenaria TaxID=6596 RepID=UPI00234F4C62|nr:uncharacterized oxidoreductase YjmC-like [Mercenaria mercenaria]